MVNPWVRTEARTNATSVDTRPIPPRNADAYRLASFKMNGERIACATANTTTATINPETDNDIPGTSHAATSSPIAEDPKKTAAR